MAGTAASVGLGVGRLAYAGIAKTIPSSVNATKGAVAKALEASAKRNQLKRKFRGDLSNSSTHKIYDPLELLAGKYNGDAVEMLAATGRTSNYWNALGATAIVAGIANEAKSQCECN